MKEEFTLVDHYEQIAGKVVTDEDLFKKSPQRPVIVPIPFQRFVNGSYKIVVSCQEKAGNEES